MIRRVIDNLTGYESFMPTMAIIFGAFLLLSDVFRVHNRDAFTWAGMALTGLAFLLVVAAAINDAIETRKWRQALDRNEAEDAQQIVEEVA